MKLTKQLYRGFIFLALLLLSVLTLEIFKTGALGNIYLYRYLFLSYVLLIAVTLLAIILAYRTESIYKVLRQFVRMIHSGKSDFEEINFPKNKFGELGEDIMNTFVHLKNSDKYKQELTHNIAHELKTPVTSIRGYLETLIQQPDIDPETRRFFLERAFNQCVRLSSIIADISVLNNIEETGEKMEFETINVKRYVREIESDLSIKLASKNIIFSEDIDESLHIDTNPFLLYALFKNLIDNSIEHGGENIRIHLTGRCDDGVTAFFTFYDTGVGVSEKHLSRIFERFYRVDEGRNRKRGGSGLGLAIVKHTVIQHNGKISATNREGGGLQFDFSLEVRRRSGGDSHQSNA